MQKCRVRTSSSQGNEEKRVEKAHQILFMSSTKLTPPPLTLPASRPVPFESSSSRSSPLPILVKRTSPRMLRTASLS